MQGAGYLGKGIAEKPNKSLSNSEIINSKKTQKQEAIVLSLASLGGSLHSGRSGPASGWGLMERRRWGAALRRASSPKHARYCATVGVMQLALVPVQGPPP